MSRRLLSMLLPVILLAVTGCMGYTGPRLRDDVELSEKWRLPSPVPPPAADGQWHFTGRGVIGEGRRLAGLDLRDGVVRWVVDLPAAYAIDGTHPVIETEGPLILVGDASVRAVDPGSGRTVWERELPAPAEVAYDARNLLTTSCGRAGCEVAALDPGERGRTIWTRHFDDRVTVRAGAGCSCAYLLGSRTITEVSTEDGRTLWVMPRPPGRTPVLVPMGDRLVLLTPPAEPGCRVTFRGVAVGVVLWTRDLPWNDPGAAGGACGFDPGRLFVRTGLDVPGIGVLTAYDVLDERPSDPGEQRLGPDPLELSWTPGVGYRARAYPDYGTAKVPSPDGRPWGRELDWMWLLRSGPGLVLWSPLYGVRWQHPAVTPVLFGEQDETRERLVYLEGDTLIGLGPAEER
ncbi:outer membrane protein assembly factor BamB family protein [Actinoplanes sp. HUAS TT8]|uniref:outer membrane protein assembly factor BamB family protein n=1 Tax=Actinoplanes sp. HUAS TT8 TaxID=3447453 RepID=UPI003F51E182